MTRKYYVYLIISILLIPVIGIIAQGSSEKTNRKEIIMSQFDNSKPVPPPGFENKQYEKPAEEDLRNKLNNLQFQVTQHEGTEQPFNNSYWDYHEDGIFVDIVSGEALFSSTDKFASGTGWPSFVRPLEPGNVVSEQDTSYGMVRTEVRSRYADSHLGHVFNDGPEPTGLRYCINSASLRFIPVKDLEKEGYGKYLSLFTEND